MGNVDRFSPAQFKIDELRQIRKEATAINGRCAVGVLSVSWFIGNIFEKGEFDKRCTA